MKTLRFLTINLVFLGYVQSCIADPYFFAFGDALYDKLSHCDDQRAVELFEEFNVKKGDAIVIDASTFSLLRNRVQDLKWEGCAGGSIANTIVGLAQLGIKNTYFVGAVSHDVLGIDFENDMKKVGIEPLLHKVEKTDGSTGVVHSIITSNDRTMLTHLGVAKKIQREHVFDVLQKLADKYDGSKFVLAEGYLWFVQELASLCKDAFKFAKEHGMQTVFTLASYHAVEHFRDEFLALLPMIDILAGNEEEFCKLFQKEGIEDVLLELSEKQVPLAVITRKEKGAIITTMEHRFDIPVPKKIEKVIDPTGAGDNWLSAFLFTYAWCCPIETCGKFANALAAKVLMHMGARCTKQDAQQTRIEFNL
jgi:sugar/nucleoside kinase (ribokinase family)